MSNPNIRVTGGGGGASGSSSSPATPYSEKVRLFNQSCLACASKAKACSATATFNASCTVAHSEAVLCNTPSALVLSS